MRKRGRGKVCYAGILKELFFKRKLVGSKNLVKWLKEGDKCTKFFHLMANSNKRFNTIDSLLIDGSLSFDLVAIREHAVNFYESLFAKSLSWRPRLDDLEFDSLSIGEASSLKAPFLEREVKDIIFGMDGNNAPG